MIPAMPCACGDKPVVAVVGHCRFGLYLCAICFRQWQEQRWTVMPLGLP